MRRRPSYDGRHHLKSSRKYDVFDRDVKRETSKKITWGAGNSIEVIEDDPLAATTDPFQIIPLDSILPNHCQPGLLPPYPVRLQPNHQPDPYSPPSLQEP